MTHIHYKFSSKLSSNTVIFDGPHITLRELKKLIMGKEKLRSGDCDLQITNAQSKEEYKDDDGPIPKGSSVIVRRIPIIGARSGSTGKTRNIEQLGFQSQLHNAGAASAMDNRRALPLFSKMTNLAVENVSEEDKIKAVLYQSSYSTMTYGTKSGASLPANYTCYRCGNAGHHIRNCPTTGDKNAEPGLRLKKSTGIPRSFMVQVDDPSIKGAMLTNCGSYAIPAIHANAYAVGKKEKPPFAPPEAPLVVHEEPIPNELLCLICHELLSDAVVIPCCGNSFCDDCIRTALLDSDQHSCPSCDQSDVSPDSLIANKFLRKAVNTFQIEQGQKNRGCGASQSHNPASAPSAVPALPSPSVPSQPQKPESLQAEAPVALPRSSEAPPTATSHAPSASEPGAPSHPAQSDPEAAEAENASEDPAAPSEPVALPEDSPAAQQVRLRATQTLADSARISLFQPGEVSAQAGEAAAGEQLQTASGAEREQQVQEPEPEPEQQQQQVQEPQQQQQQQQQQQASSGAAPGRSQPPSSTDNSENFAPKDASSFSSSFSSFSSSSSSSYPAAPQPLFNSPHFHPFLPAQQHLSAYPPGYPPAVPVWMLQTPPGSEWYVQQGRKSQRSPHGDSTYRRSPSHSKSKSSRSYSRSSSKSRSRSRSLSRSRRRSPYSHHRSLHSSYSYGYKRSPTPSSSSSPQLPYRSRSKSPSDQRKKSHHHSKRSASSRHSSRRRAESPRREAGGSENPYGKDGGFDVEHRRYLQWEREYKEWCEKYFSSYVSHFHQPPPAPFHLNPAALAPWQQKAGGGQRVDRERRPHGGRSARRGDRSPPPSRSSSDSYSTASRSASDSRSSASPVPSPRSQSSNDGAATPLESKDLQRGLAAGKQKSEEGSDYSELAEGRGEEKQQVENAGASKNRRGRPKREKEDRAECSHPEPAGSVDEDRKEQRSYGSGEDNSPHRQAEKSDKDPERRRRRKRNSAKDRFAEGGEHSDCRRDGQGQDKRRPGKERVRSDKEKYARPRGRSASDSRSERTEKRKRQEKASSPLREADKLQTWKSESHDQPDKQEKKERRTRPATEHIWEGGMKVKAQKKISINISLDARQREAKTDDNGPVYLEDAAGKTGGEYESPQDGGSGDAMEEEEDKKEAVGIWDVTSSGDRKDQTEEETSGGAAAAAAAEDSWLRALGVAEEGEEEEEEPRAERRRGENVLTTSGGGRWRNIDGGNAEVLAATREEEETRRNLHGGPQVSWGDGSAENHEEQKVVANTVQQCVPARASEGEDDPAARQISSPKWDLEETEAGKQDIKVQTDVPAASHPSQSSRVTTASGKTERGKGQDWHGVTEREMKAAASSSSGGLAPSGGKDGADSPPFSRRDQAKEARQEQKESVRWRGERRAGREGGRSPASWSHRADRETTTSDSKIRNKHSPHRRQPSERHAGSGHRRRRSPSRSKERRRRASSPPQESSGRSGDRREGRKHRKTATEEEEGEEEEEEEGKWPRDELEGGQWEVVDGVDVGWELEEGERPGSGKSSGSSTGGRRRQRAEKRRASPEPPDDWRPRKHKHRE